MFDVYCVSCVTPNHYYFSITKNRQSRFKDHEKGRTPFTAFHGVKKIEVENALGFLLKYLSKKYRPCHIIKTFDRAFEEGTLKNVLQHIAAVQEEEDLKSKRRGSPH